MYHGNLWLSNLAIEGEGADAFIAAEYPRVIDEYMKRAVYPDGSAMEDGYVVNLALREGSNVLVAAEKRGRGHIASQKFRNLVYHVAHMHEPWACAECAFSRGGGGGGGLACQWRVLRRCARRRLLSLPLTRERIFPSSSRRLRACARVAPKILAARPAAASCTRASTRWRGTRTRTARCRA